MASHLRTIVGLLTSLISGLACAADAPFKSTACEGSYAKHLQGVCTDDRAAIFWSFTDVLVKTDLDGRVQKSIAVASHHGDLCYLEGRIYVAVNLGKFNKPEGNADSWVYVYRADDLGELARHAVPEVVFGAGGIGFDGARFIVVGGLLPNLQENYAYEYDQGFQFVKRHVIRSGYTRLGIQTATWAQGHWWFGCYGEPKVLLKTDAAFNLVGRYVFDCSLGIVGLPDGRFLVARGGKLPEKRCSGRVVLADADREKGLVVREESPDAAAGSR